MQPVPYIDKVPSFEIRDGTMFITADDWAMCTSLRLYRLGMAKSARVIAEYEARKAEVVPFKRRRG